MDGEWSSSNGKESDSCIEDDEQDLIDEHYKIFPISIEKADDVCIRLNSLLKQGTIKRTGILYKYLNDVTKHLENGNHAYDEEVIQFFNTIGYLGGERTVNFLRGPMWFEGGRGGVHNPDDACMNFGGPSHITRLKHFSGYTTESGIIKQWLKSLLEYASSTSKCNALIDNDLVQVFPVALANDGTAIKPSLQFDEDQNHIVGLAHSIDHKFVKENVEPDVEYLKSSIVTEANVTYASVLDNSVSIPVAVYYKPKSGKTGTELKDQFLSEVSLVQMCVGCLDRISSEGNILKPINQAICSSICKTCLELKMVCADCTAIGHTSIYSPLRACDNCLKDHSKCIKTTVLVYTADCEQGNKCAFEMIISDRESNILDSQYLFSVLPDAVHVGKSLKASFANWHILLDNDRSSLPMIRTMRDTSVTLQRQLPRDSVINKDRMDVDCIMRLTKTEVIDEIEKQQSVVHTLVPEKYRLCESNKKGLYKHPVAITLSDNGKIYALDYDESSGESRLIELRLHVPVDVTVHKSYKDARCLITLKDLVYICKKNTAISIWPEESVRVKPQKMTKAQIVAVLAEAEKCTQGTAEQLRKGLETHLIP